MSRVLGISGSLRTRSYNTALLHTIGELLPDSWTMDVVTPVGLPLYNEEIQKDGWPSAVLSLVDQIRQADIVVVATPEYNYSIPGGLKNAIDWVSRVPDQPFRNKVVGIVGAASGRMGTIRAQMHLRQCFQFLEAKVLSRPEVLIGSAPQAFSDGVLVDQACLTVLQSFVMAITDLASVDVA